MKPWYFIAALIAVSPVTTLPVVSSAATETQPYYSTSRSTLGELMDNPATRAIVARYLPEVTNSSHVAQARGLTLKSMQPLAPQVVTDEKLAKIDEELSKIPPPGPTS